MTAHSTHKSKVIIHHRRAVAQTAVQPGRPVVAQIAPPTGAHKPWLPLEHVVPKRLQQITLATAVQIELDASLWGRGGAVPRRTGVRQEFWAQPCT